MKKKIIIFVVICIAVIISLIAVFGYYHPTHYKFNDRFIIGNSEENIVEKYGEFSKSQLNDDGKLYRGTYMIHGDTKELAMSYDNSLWYEIYFENGIAVSVRLQEGEYGG